MGLCVVIISSVLPALESSRSTPKDELKVKLLGSGLFFIASNSSNITQASYIFSGSVNRWPSWTKMLILETSPKLSVLKPLYNSFCLTESQLGFAETMFTYCTMI